MKLPEQLLSSPLLYPESCLDSSSSLRACIGIWLRLALYAVRNGITSFTKLKALKFRELRSLYPQLPSHYAYAACQDASTRAKSFLKLKKKELAKKDYPEVNGVSIWLDDHLWRMKGLTSIEIATHRGWVAVELEPHRQYWRYASSSWRLASEAKVKLDRRNTQLIIHLVFKKSVEAFKPRSFISVDVNENHVAVLIDGKVYLFETGFRDIILGYYYRRKRVQERYNKLYGVNCRIKRKILRKLKEKSKKSDLKWKLANMVVRVAKEMRCAVVLERLGKNPAKEMINHIGNVQLRHRIYQASFKGVQRAIEEKAREHGVPVVYVNPRNTPRCVQYTTLEYSTVMEAESASAPRKGSCGIETWLRVTTCSSEPA